jgi:hypothetical protein
MRAASARRRAPAAANDDRRLSGWHRGRAGQQNAEQERAGEEVPHQVQGTDKGEALDQLLVSDDGRPISSRTRSKRMRASARVAACGS